MNAGSWLRDRPSDDRLLVVDVAGARRLDAHVADLPKMLRAGDLVVLNDAATLPASLRARIGETSFELRLASAVHRQIGWAVAFGAGDWRTRTEHRALPPKLAIDDALVLEGSEQESVSARVVESVLGRLVRLRWSADDATVVSAIYAHGRPIQYAHLERDLPLWAAQTPIATRPWAVEMPSAGRAIGPSIVADLRRHGVEVATLTHAAGLSSTGDARLDAMLPLPERYDIPIETAEAIATTKRRGGRLIAIGTTVVRALESAENCGSVHAGVAVATLKLDAAYRRRIVDGIVTGFHDEGSSHLRLLSAFAPVDLLARTYAHAERSGYLCHELGDVNLILAA